MFSEHKNSYLQLVCAANPRLINKAVALAMRYKRRDPHDVTPAAHRIESMQPSLYAPMVDVSRAQIGFGRIGLRVLNRELSSNDSIIQLQAIHSILDQVQISENAMFLINLNVVYRLIDLMQDRDPIVREKICMILSILATYQQGRERIMSRPVAIDNLMYLIMRDRKEIRYAAAYTLRTLSKHRCACEIIMKTEKIVPNLLKMIKDDHAATVLLHLKTLARLSEWDPEPALRANAFQVMIILFRNYDIKVAAKAMDCMSQLCKHNVGKRLADMYDMTNFLFKHYLTSPHIILVIATLRLMAFTTQTTRAKWRAKELTVGLTKRLVNLCLTQNLPQLQIRVMQVLINLCDCPDIRYHLKNHWERKIKAINIRTHEQWDGTSENTTFSLETGHLYRTMCIENVETIKNEYGDNANVINVHSYLRTLQETKERLIKAINFKPHKD